MRMALSQILDYARPLRGYCAGEDGGDGAYFAPILAFPRKRGKELQFCAVLLILSR